MLNLLLKPEKRTLLLSSLGHLAFLLLFIMTLIYYKERALYTDSAFVLFRMINMESFDVENMRYSSFIPQIITVLAIKLHLPLKAVMIIFSASMMLFFYLLYLVCCYVLKNVTAGLVIALLFLTCISHSFFHTVTETYQGLAWCCVFYALLNHKSFIDKKTAGGIKMIVQYILSILLVLLAYYSHPVTIFPLLFIILYTTLKNGKALFSIENTLIGIFIGLIFSLKFLTTRSDSYEGSFLSNLTNINSILNVFSNSYSIQYLGGHMGLYFSLVLCFVIVLGILVFESKWKLLLSITGFVFAFFLVTILSYFQGDADIMMERAYVPFVVVIMIPFVDLILTEGLPKVAWLHVVLLSTVVVWTTLGIKKTGAQYSKRISYVNHLIVQAQSKGVSKAVVEKATLDQNLIQVPWAFSIETLLLSSMRNPDKPVTIYLADSPTMEFDKNNPELFLAVNFWRDWNYKDLNPHYFKLKHGSYSLRIPQD